jgi:hypothetical protein
MSTVDLVKELRPLYAPSARHPSIVDVPEPRRTAPERLRTVQRHPVRPSNKEE